MDSSYISKIEKAKRYAQERHRFRFEQMSVKFTGDNNDHGVSLSEGVWTCDCEYFVVHAWCCHTRALEILLDQMLPETTSA